MNRLLLLLGMLGVLGLLATLGGCASFEGAPTRPEQSAGLQKADAAYHDALSQYYAAGGAAQKQAVRNLFIESRVGLVDHHYASFRASLYAQRVGSAVGVDLATLGLNIAGVLTPGESAKTAMNALSGGLIGGKASVDKNVYFDRTLPALLSQMEAQRNTVRLRMLAGMDEPTSRYPMMQAAADLQEYYAAGTLAGAVSGITQQAAATEQSSAAKLAARLPTEQEVTQRLKAQGFAVQRAGPVDAAGTRLLACLRVGGAAQAENEREMVAWLKGQGIDAAPPFGLTDFLTSPVLAERRAQAAADTALMARFKNCP